MARATRRLELDDEGYLSLWIDPGDGLDLVVIDLGPVETADAPPELREDLATLRANWLDRPTRAEMVAEARAAYARGLRLS